MSTLREGNFGDGVKQLQTLLITKGFSITADGDFGSGTAKAVKAFQEQVGLAADGIAGANTWKALGVTDLSTISTNDEFDEKYKDVTFQGSIFPDQSVSNGWNVKLSSEIIEEYLPALENAIGDQPKGLKLLCTAMANKEGFTKYSRSYRTNNPGNIGNTDSGRNKENSTLSDGILLQKDYILSIINDKHKAYPMNKKVIIAPYFSPEIAKHSKTYGLSPYLPGYAFTFTGQLNQFVKIYATGARATNNYLSMIVSYFNQHGIDITQESKIQDVINLG